MVGTILDISERKQSENSLRKNEKLLAEGQEIAQIGSWQYVQATGLLEYSDEAYHILGVDPDTSDSSAENIVALVHPDDLERFMRDWYLLRNQAINFEIEHGIVRPDGAVRYVHQISRAVLDDDGTFLVRRGTVQDVTERREIEDHLRESESHLARAQKLGHIGSWWRNIDSKTLIWSNEMYRIFGVDQATFVPTTRTFRASLHPDDVEIYDPYLANLQVRDDMVAMDFRIIRPYGEVRYMQQRSEPVYDDNGVYVSRSGTTQDITERKLIEVRLTESEAHLAEAQKIAQIGSWQYDDATDTLNYSEQIYKILGVTRKTFKPSVISLLALFHPDDRKHFERKIHSARYEARELNYDHRIIWPDGVLRYIHQINQPIVDDQGKVIARRGTIQDVTDRRLAENKIHELNEGLEQRVLERTQELRDEVNERKKAQAGAGRKRVPPARRARYRRRRDRHHRPQWHHSFFQPGRK